MTTERIDVKQRIALKYRELLKNPGQIVILDTETTGPNPKVDQPVSIAMIDGEGNELMNRRVKPGIPIGQGAIDVHGITNEAVADEPEFSGIFPIYRAILNGKTALAYNADYDQAIIRNAVSVTALHPNAQWECVMKDYAEFNGEIGYRGTPRWWKLSEACKHEEIEVKDAHDALGDIRMTLELMHVMAAYEPPVADTLTPLWDKRLLELAQAERNLAEQLPQLQAEYDRLYAEQLASLDKLIAQVKALPEILRDELRKDALIHYQFTGEKTPHNLITVCETTRLVYDHDAALEWARAHAPSCVRIKESLDVKMFEGGLDDWLNAPPVEREIVPVVAISKVDHLIGDE